MTRALLLASGILVATTMAASAQFTLPTSGFSDFNSSGPAGTFGSDMMNQDMSVTGFRTKVSATSATRLAPMDDPLAARDGCINYPGRAHNSADCSLLNYWDPAWEVPNKPVSEMTGAEENMLRSYNLLHDHPFKFTYRR